MTGNTGTVWVRVSDEEEWIQARVELTESFIKMELQHGVELFELSAEHYVGDSGAKDHAFIVSDLIETLYIAVDNREAKEEWMQSIAVSLRKLGTQRIQRKDRSSRHLKVVEDEGKPEEQSKTGAQIRLEHLTNLFEILTESNKLCFDRRKDAEARAYKMLLSHEELERRHQAEKKAAEEIQRMNLKREEEERKKKEQMEKLKRLQEQRRKHEQEEAERLVAAKQEQQNKRASLKLKDSKSLDDAGISKPYEDSTCTKSAGEQKQKGLLSRVQAWNSKVDEFQEKQAENPFSAKSKVTSPSSRPGDDGYGRPKEGTKTAERAKMAQAWVDKEIDKFLGVVRQIGSKSPEGKIEVTFGKLFVTYQEISDSLVGIMMRAKKRKLIHYEGDMLFQNRHDHVMVTIL